MLCLRVNAHRWRQHIKAFCADTPGLVPVAKGNGYGFGIRQLAAAAAAAGPDTIAVSTLADAEIVAKIAGFSRIIVLTPWHHDEQVTTPHPAVVQTVGSVESLRALSGQRVVIECMTSLRRHGIRYDDLAEAAHLVDDVRLDGWAITMPIDRRGLDAVAETSVWVDRLRDAGLPVQRMYLSHLTAAERAAVSAQYPGVCFPPRIGTALWLGDRSTFQATSLVLDVVPISRGDTFGYRQRRARSSGTVLIVGGGTSHGIGLNVPRSVHGVFGRAKEVAIGALASLNRTRSPFHWRGRQLWFAEPPHMQVSLLWLPHGITPPRVDDELDVDVRMTTTVFDVVEFVELENRRHAPVRRSGQ